MMISIMAAGQMASFACALPLTPPWRYSDISDGSSTLILTPPPPVDPALSCIIETES